MASKNVREINDLNFQDEVLGSPEPFLLDFSATWCGPCKALLPIVEKIADENVGTLRVGKIDIDTSPAIAAKLGVRGVPSIVVFKDGKEAARRLGLANRETILSLVRG
jgi:thioredoxin 1